MRIFPKLFLLVAATATLSALAMAGVLAISLQNGFAGYLQARDAELMQEFGATFDEVATSERLTKNHAIDLGAIMTIMAAAGQIPEAPPFFLQLLKGAGTKIRMRAGPPMSFAMRVMVFDTAGRRVVGPLVPRGSNLDKNIIIRPIRSGDNIIGTIRLLPRGPFIHEIEGQFLRSQYVSGAFLALLLIGVAAFVSFWLARGGVRQLGAVQQATTTIAQGDFTARVPVRGLDELSKLASDINSMAEALQTLETARRRWLAEIGHELRTPLSVLTGELDALRDGIRKLDLVAIGSLSEETQRLNLLVDDLHFLAISDLSLQRYAWLECDAREVVDRVVQRFTPIAAHSKLSLIFEVDHSGPVQVVWSPLRIEQLLANLLVNSIRYTDPPGEICLRLTEELDRVTIIIEDSPPGVPQSQLANLFEPFYRLEEARDRVSGGSGLGLAVSAAIAEAHNGSIRAAASPLGGISMLVTLPRNADCN